MELKHFVFGKFSTIRPEFGVRIADPLMEQGGRMELYGRISKFIINNFDAVLYGKGYSFSLLPELIISYDDYCLYLKFYPPFPEERGTMVSPLFHCFVLDPNELKQLNYQPWMLKKYFIKRYDHAAITGPDGNTLLTTEEASRFRFKSLNIELTLTTTGLGADNNNSAPVPFSDYYAVITNSLDSTFNYMDIEKKLSVFSSGMILNATQELLEKFGNRSIHFAFLESIYEHRIPGTFNKITEIQFKELAVNEKPAAETVSPPAPQPVLRQRSQYPAVENRPAATNSSREDRQQAAPPQGPANPDPLPGNYEVLNSVQESVRDNGNQTMMPAEEQSSVYQQLKELVLAGKAQTQSSEINFNIKNNNPFEVIADVFKNEKNGPARKVETLTLHPHSALDYTDRDVEDGRIYHYQVKAILGESNGIKSVSEKSLQVHSIPKAVKQLNVTQNNNSINLQWKAADNEFESRYTISRVVKIGADSGKEEVLISKFLSISYTDLALPADAAFRYRIYVSDAATNQVSRHLESHLLYTRSTPPQEQVAVLQPDQQDNISPGSARGSRDADSPHKGYRVKSKHIYTLLSMVIVGLILYINIPGLLKQKPAVPKSTGVHGNSNGPLPPASGGSKAAPTVESTDPAVRNTNAAGTTSNPVTGFTPKNQKGDEDKKILKVPKGYTPGVSRVNKDSLNKIKAEATVRERDSMLNLLHSDNDPGQ